MKSTSAYAAKRALFALLKSKTAVGMPLDGTQISYEYPARDIGRRLVYGGGVRFNTTDAAGEWGLVVSETVIVGVYIRVLRPDADVQTAESDVETLADAICKVFADEPDLGGDMTWLGVSSGNGDYSHGPDGPEAVLSLQVVVGAVLT